MSLKLKLPKISGVVKLKHIEAFGKAALKHSDTHGRVTPGLQGVLLHWERTFGRRMTRPARIEFQHLVAELGAKMEGKIRLPKEDMPFWLLHPDPTLKGFRSHARVPKTADFVIIGAGLTGASAAYHLKGEAKAGLKVVVLEQAELASGASGRNGGNFELMPENYFGEFGDKGEAGGYDGILAERLKIIQSVYPSLSQKKASRAAAWQVRKILQFSKRNIERFLRLVSREQIKCDLVAQGWLRIAANPREARGIKAEVKLGNEEGIRFRLISPLEIKRRYNLKSGFAGRFVKRSGNYHPYKFVTEVFKKVLKDGVELYTHTRVERLTPKEKGFQIVETSRGTIRAKKVILATNAFASELLSELDGIRPHVSQVLNFNHVKNNLLGITATMAGGELYANVPKQSHYTDHQGVARGVLLVGGGGDRAIESVRKVKRNQKALEETLVSAVEYFPQISKQPPVRANAGPMGFTADKIPVIGFLNRKGRDYLNLIVAAGFNGYGGSACVEAGFRAVQMAKGGKYSNATPEAMYSPKRFLCPEPLPGFGGR